jgi:hypothetical protein
MNRRAFNSESDLVDVVEVFLKGLGYSVGREVPNLGRYMDLAAVSGSEILAVEAKLRNWRVGIEQLRTHGHACDMRALAIDASFGCRALLSEAQTRNIGVLYVHRTPEVVEVKEPWSRSTDFWKPQRDKIIKRAKELAC